MYRYLIGENIWLTQEKIALLFGVDRTVVTKHLKNIFETKELVEDSVCAKITHTADDGKNPSPKMNMKSIESFKIDCMKAILIGKLKRGMVNG